jgi:hypothetical protein
MGSASRTRTLSARRSRQRTRCVAGRSGQAAGYRDTAQSMSRVPVFPATTFVRVTAMDRRGVALSDGFSPETSRRRGSGRRRPDDGFLATFDGPAKAVECARATIGASGRLDLRSERDPYGRGRDHRTRCRRNRHPHRCPIAGTPTPCARQSDAPYRERKPKRSRHHVEGIDSTTFCSAVTV